MSGGAPRAARRPAAGAAARAAHARALVPWVLLLAGAHLARVTLAARAPLIEVDGAYWAAVARAFATGDPMAWSPAWPPLFPWLAAHAARALSAAGAPPGPALFESALRLVASLAGTLTLVPLWWLARRVAGRTAAWGAVVLAAAHPRLLEYSAAALAESTFTLCVVTACACAAWADGAGTAAPARPRRRALLDAAAGAAFGLAFLARPEGLALGGAAWIAGLAGRARRARPLFVAALLLVSAPWLLALHARLGHWSLGEKGAYNFARAHRALYERHVGPLAPLAARVNDGPELAAAAPPAPGGAAALVARAPGEVAAAALGRFGRLALSSLPAAAYLPYVLLAAAGVALVRPAAWRPAFVPVAAMLVLYAPFSADRRFLVPAVPFVLVAAGAALGALAARLPPRARLAGGAALALACAGGFAYAWAGAGHDEGSEQRRAGEWLRAAWRDAAPSAARFGGRPVVMARKPWVAHYAGGVIAELPDAPPESLVALARRKGVDVIVADDRAAAGDRPQLAAWVAGGAGAAGLPTLWRGAVREGGRRLRVVLLDARPPAPGATAAP
uniref:Phospholipid carrier-dependent glycosyltransferase n=1 Tax=Eiseniibacteriota bacterium TaxID=2212470 RepID=A0A832I1J3_UNCEI